MSGTPSVQFSFPWSSVGPVIGVFGLWTIGLIWYIIRCQVKGRYRVRRVDQMGGTVLCTSWLMEFTYWFVHGISNFLIKMKVSPDSITGMSLVLAIASSVAFYDGRFGLGGWLMIAAALFDVFDGMVARAIGVASEAGEFLDSVVDRYAELFGFIALMGYYYPFQPMIALLVGMAMVGSIMITYNRAKGEAQGITDVPSGYMRRHERIFYLGVGTAFSPIPAVWLEPGVARPVYHFAVLAIFIVALVGNLTAVKLAIQVHGRLKQQGPRPRVEPDIVEEQPAGGNGAGLVTAAVAAAGADQETSSAESHAHH